MLDRVDQARDRIEEVLAVVEHQQQPLRREIVEHRLVERPTRQRLHPQARRHGLPHRLRVGDRRELAQPRTVRELADDLRRDLERETGLADATHTRSASPATIDAPTPTSDAISASRPTNVVT